MNDLILVYHLSTFDIPEAGTRLEMSLMTPYQLLRLPCGLAVSPTTISLLFSPMNMQLVLLLTTIAAGEVVPVSPFILLIVNSVAAPNYLRKYCHLSEMSETIP